MQTTTNLIRHVDSEGLNGKPVRRGKERIWSQLLDP